MLAPRRYAAVTVAAASQIANQVIQASGEVVTLPDSRIRLSCALRNAKMPWCSHAISNAANMIVPATVINDHASRLFGGTARYVY